MLRDFCALFELVDFIYHRLKALKKSLTAGQYIWFEKSGLELNPRHFKKKRNECDFVELKGSKRHVEIRDEFEVDTFRKIRSSAVGIWLEKSKGIPVQRSSYTLLNRFLMHWFCRPRGDIKKSGEEIFVDLCKDKGYYTTANHRRVWVGVIAIYLLFSVDLCC